MKKSIFLLIFSFFTISLFSQELRFKNNCNFCFRAIDTKINIREKPDTDSKILGQISEPDIIYVNKDKSTTNWLFCYIPKIDRTAYVYAEYFSETPDYNNENGSIIYEKKDGNQTILIRKHNQVIEDINLEKSFGNINTIPVLNDYKFNSKKIGYIKSGDTITVSKVMTKKSDKNTALWLGIIYKNKEGWIFITDEDKYYIPYSSYDFYSILYYKNVGNEKVPVRNIKLSGKITGPINLYKEPDKKSEVVTQAHMTFNEYKDDDGEAYYTPVKAIWLEGSQLLFANGTAWIYTEFEGKYGWADFNELSIERGGYRIYTPENCLSDLFGPWA